MKQLSVSRLAFPAFGISYLYSWLIWGTLAFLTRSGLVEPETTVFYVLFVAGGLGPTLMPLLLILLLLPRVEAIDLVKNRFFRFSTPWFYYAAAVGFTVLFFLLHYGATQVATGWYPYTRQGQSWFSLITLFPIMIIGGGLEEVGWRGIGVPELLTRFKPLIGTLIIGIIWMLWHVPLFLIPGTGQYGSDFISFAAMGFAFSLILTPLMFFSGTAVPCIIAHALFNALYATGRFPPLQPDMWDQRLIDLLLVMFGSVVWLGWFSIVKAKKSLKSTTSTV
ncbi:MAG: CPBP family intramembrane glutamic endopeptidase [Spirochaetota bacterium]